jgi:hypothetical protein
MIMPQTPEADPLSFLEGLQYCCLGDWEDQYDAVSKYCVEYWEHP